MTFFNSYQHNPPYDNYVFIGYRKEIVDLFS